MLGRKKEKKPEAVRSNLEVLAVRSYDEGAGCFVMEDHTYMDLFQILSSDRSNQQGDELQYSIYNFTRFFRLYGPDSKIISMNFPVNTSFQRGVLGRKVRKTTDDVRRGWLDRETEELARLDQNIMRKEFYYMYFGKNREDMLKNKNNIEKWIGFGRSPLVQGIEKEKKIQIIRKLCNMNTLILSDELKGDEDETSEEEG